MKNFKNVSMYNDKFLIDFEKIIYEVKKNKNNPIILDKANEKIKYLSNAKSILCFKHDSRNLKDSEKEIGLLNVKFNKKIKSLLKEKIERKDSLKFINQLKLYINSVSIYLNTQNSNYHILEGDENDSFIKSNEIDIFFVIVIEALFQKLRKNYSRLDLDDEEYINYEIFQKPYIDSSDLHYSIIEELFKSMVSLLYTHYRSKNVYTNEKKFSSYFYTNFKEIDIIKKSSPSLNLSKQLEEVFKNEIAIKTITDSLENKKFIRNIYIIPDCFLDVMVPRSHIPEIKKPENWYQYDIMKDVKFIKKIKNGSSEIILSPESLKAIEISQMKKFRINTKMIELLEELDTKKYEDVKNLDLSQFTPLSVIEKEYNYLIENKHKLINKQVYKKHIYPIYKESKNHEEFLEKLSKTDTISVETYQNHLEYKQRQKIYRSMYENRRISNSFIQMAKILTGIDFYYTNALDYRSRMYPFNFLFNRTSGVYKHFLMESEKRKLTYIGLINLLFAYYSFDNSILNKFKKVCYNLDTKDELMDFYQKNKIEKIKGNYIYFKILENVLDNLKNKNYICSFLIEIDQKSSSSVFLSFLLNHKKLAEKCNLLGDTNNDVPNYLSSKTEEFFTLKKWNCKEDFEILEQFLNNRKLHKYAFMCFCYNQQPYGRWKQWIKGTSININKRHKECITKFATSYEEFLELCFPEIIKKKDAINEIYKIIINNLEETIVKTVDDSILKWKVYKKVNVTKKTISVYDTKNKHLSYKNGQIKNYQELNINSMIRSFLPGLIHSVDASIMRIFINKMYEKTNQECILQHVHDAVLLHPNYVEDFYSVVKEVYTKEKRLHDVLTNSFINNSLLLMNQESKKEIIKIYKNIFLKNKDSLVIEKIKINPKSLYSFET